MEKRLINQLWRIPLSVTALFKIIYVLAFLYLGYMPSTEKMALLRGQENVFWNLPIVNQTQFGTSRWWDLVTIFILTLIIVRGVHIYKEAGEKLSWRSFRLFANAVILLPIFLFFIAVLVDGLEKTLIPKTEGSNPKIIFLIIGFYLIFFIIIPIIMKILKTNVASLFNWALDKQLIEKNSQIE